jgi:hypothetical protein
MKKNTREVQKQIKNYSFKITANGRDRKPHRNKFISRINLLMTKSNRVG